MSGDEDLAVRAPPDHVFAVAELVAAARDRPGQKHQRWHLGSLDTTVFGESSFRQRQLSVRRWGRARPREIRGLFSRCKLWVTTSVARLYAPSGSALVSRNPAADGAVVFETGFTVGAVDDAASAAAAAQPAWAATELRRAQRAPRPLQGRACRARGSARRSDRDRDRQDPQRSEGRGPDAAQSLRSR